MSQYTFHDSDGDGTADYGAADHNGDGQVDEYAYDTNGDGYLDAYRVDVDGNGYFESIGYDSDQNGVAERFEIDVDGDGVVETSTVDLNQDGVVDAYAAPQTGGQFTAVPQSEYSTVDQGLLVGEADLYSTTWTGETSGAYGTGPTTHPAQPLIESPVVMNDPYGRQAVADIIDSQHIMTSVWTLPDDWEIRRERY